MWSLMGPVSDSEELSLIHNIQEDLAHSNTQRYVLLVPTQQHYECGRHDVYIQYLYMCFEICLKQKNQLWPEETRFTTQISLTLAEMMRPAVQPGTTVIRLFVTFDFCLFFWLFFSIHHCRPWTPRSMVAATACWLSPTQTQTRRAPLFLCRTLIWNGTWPVTNQVIKFSLTSGNVQK